MNNITNITKHFFTDQTATDHWRGICPASDAWWNQLSTTGEQGKRAQCGWIEMDALTLLFSSKRPYGNLRRRYSTAPGLPCIKLQTPIPSRQNYGAPQNIGFYLFPQDLQTISVNIPTRCNPRICYLFIQFNRVSRCLVKNLVLLANLKNMRFMQTSAVEDCSQTSSLMFIIILCHFCTNNALYLVQHARKIGWKSYPSAD